MVVGFVSQYAEPAVELLYKKQSHHLMGKGHFRQAYSALGPVVSRIIEPVSTSNNKHQLFAPSIHLFLKEFGELNRTVLFAFLIEKKYRITIL